VSVESGQEVVDGRTVKAGEELAPGRAEATLTRPSAPQVSLRIPNRAESIVGRVRAALHAARVWTRGHR